MRDFFREKRRIIPFVVLAIIFVVLNLVQQDEVHVPATSAGVYVYDEANMIDDDTEAEINNICATLEKGTTAELVVVSYVDSNMSLESYATKLFNKMGIGQAETNNGVLLLMQKEGNHVRLEVGKGLDDDLTDYHAGEILDKYYVPYRDSNTSKAALNTIKAVSGYLYDYYGVESDMTKDGYKVPESDKVGDIIGIGSICAVIIFVVGGVVYIVKRDNRLRRNKNRLILPGEKRYRRSGGITFLNDLFSSGDSDGGFGGGSSDGGGASR